MILRAPALITTALTVTLVLCGHSSATFAQPGPTPSPTPAAPVTEDPLLTQIDLAIQANSQRYLVANSNSPWQIFHGLLAYRKDFQVRVGNQKMSAIDWVATMEPQFDRLPLLLKTQHGAKFHPFTRPWAFEGHPAQMLALMSESHLPVDFKIKIGAEEVTIGDFLHNAMMEVNTREEITWVLWSLINYVKVDSQWVNQWGQPWSIEQLVQHQVRAKVEGGPCGGNHGLFVLVRARDKYLAAGRPLRGVWLEADQKIQRYIQIARSLQNPDGSFSNEFYEGRGFSRDMNERFDTTGHTFEFLSIGLSDAQLNEPWVRSAAMVLANELYQHRRAQPSCGPMYHSLNALMNYRNRLRPPQPVVAAVAPPTVPTTPVPVTTPSLPNVPAPTTPVIVGPTPTTANKDAVKATIIPTPGNVTLPEVIPPADALRPLNVVTPSATASPAIPPASPILAPPTVSVPTPKSPVVTAPTTLLVVPTELKPVPVNATPASDSIQVIPATPLKLPAGLEAKLLKISISPPAPVASTSRPVPNDAADPTAPRLLVPSSGDAIPIPPVLTPPSVRP